MGWKWLAICLNISLILLNRCLVESSYLLPKQFWSICLSGPFSVLAESSSYAATFLTQTKRNREGLSHWRAPRGREMSNVIQVAGIVGKFSTECAAQGISAQGTCPSFLCRTVTRFSCLATSPSVMLVNALASLTSLF